MVGSVGDMSSHASSPTRQGGGVAPSRVETASAAAPVRNPAESFSFSKGQMDSETGMYVILLRDSASGEVRVQIPAQRAASTYRKSQTITGPAEGGQDRPRHTSPAVSGTNRTEVDTPTTAGTATAPDVARGDA